LFPHCCCACHGVSEKKHRGEMVKVAIAVLGLAVLLGVVAGIEEVKFDTLDSE